MTLDIQDYASPSDYPYDLGKYSLQITTNNADTQIWFNRGLVWLYGFNLEEATICFRHALKHDGQCAMAAWGLAYALGPHYNFQWASQGPEARAATVKKTHEAARRAHEIASCNQRITAIELAMVHAIQARYPQGTPPESLSDFGQWNTGYANAMQFVYEQFPDDLDVATLYADAMLNLTPWRSWDVETGVPTEGSRALHVRSVLEKAFELPGGKQHAGLLHLYIHLMEMSPWPELAVSTADRLRHLAPDSGHLQHMSSHIYVLVGSYDLATDSNEDAVVADDKYLSRNSLGLYTNYMLHNITSLIFAAMMAGASQPALDGCTRLENIVTEPFLRIQEPNMGDFAEAFLSTRPHVLIRFGRWQEILDLPMPGDPELYTVTITVLHYAKGVAYAALGNVHEAERQRDLFLTASSKVSESRVHFPNKSRNVLGVAKEMLDGELEYRKGNFDTAFQHLTEAIAREDKLMYSEPPGWMLPARHATAALLLEQGQVRRAAELYAEDLGLSFDGKEATLPRPRRHPRNVWALQGFHECLQRLKMEEEAKAIEEEMKTAKKSTDIEITTSCFCRLSAPQPRNGGDTSAMKSKMCHL